MLRLYDLADSLTCDTLGLYARSVADLELLANVFKLEDDVTPAPVSLKGAKFGFAKTSVWDKAEQPIQDAFALAKKLLEAEGAVCEDVELPEEFTTLQEKYRCASFPIVSRFQASADLDPSRPAMSSREKDAPPSSATTSARRTSSTRSSSRTSRTTPR